MMKRALSALLFGYVVSITLGICPLQLAPKASAAMEHGTMDVGRYPIAYVLDTDRQTHEAPLCENCLGSSGSDTNVRSGAIATEGITLSGSAPHWTVREISFVQSSLMLQVSPPFNSEEQPPPPDGPAMVGVVILRT